MLDESYAQVIRLFREAEKEAEEKAEKKSEGSGSYHSKKDVRILRKDVHLIAHSGKIRSMKTFMLIANADDTVTLEGQICPTYMKGSKYGEYERQYDEQYGKAAEGKTEP